MPEAEYAQAVEELQKRVDMLHVLAGIEVSDEARGYALGTMQSAIDALDYAAESIVQASGLTVDGWREYQDAERKRRDREWRKERRKAR